LLGVEDNLGVFNSLLENSKSFAKLLN
jgi:hypothetical protein